MTTALATPAESAAATEIDPMELRRCLGSFVTE